MKRLMMLAALVLLLGVAACAAAEPVTGMGLTFDSGDTHIDFGDVRIEDDRFDEIVALLDQLPNLTSADMYAGSMKTSTYEVLAERYPNVRFGWTVRVGDHRVRTDATAFSTLHDPLKDKPHYNESFKGLKFCKDLKALDIGHNEINDLSFLSELTGLKVLILACNDIKDISVIAQMKELEYLELFTNPITDITPIAELTNLRDLNLSNLKIDDLTPLYDLPNLERFRLCMNNILTDEQRAEFEAQYPDVIIGWKDHPTGEGWRDHPNYDVISRVFRGGVYEPFASREENQQRLASGEYD
ncbi:MAG: leucine-rich repeat domain-containing protein [Clostridia bacterium]|nr:leucine-rich repeat domain-containing protein [Clostridia bacterium]